MLSVGSMELQFFNHPEGYVEPTPVGTTKSVKGFDTGSGQTTYSSYQYIFQYTDHLGNVRLSYADSDLNGAITDGEIIEESNYYPFGLKQKGYNNVISSNGNDLAQQWKFGGKEYNQELGLNWYDISARNYDPAIGRWMNLDPLAESMRRHSPYNYAFDNPIYFMDPDGMTPVETGGGGGGSSGGESSGDDSGGGDLGGGMSGGFEGIAGGDSVATIYVDEQGDEIVNTDDGSDDVIVVSDDDLEKFQELVDNTDKSMLDSEEWNKNMKADILGFDEISEMDDVLGSFSNQWSRQGAIDFLQDPTPINALKMSLKEAIAQNLNPLNHLPGPNVKVKTPKINVQPNIPKTLIDADIKNQNSWVEFNRQAGKGTYTKDKYGGSSEKAKNARRSAYDNFKKQGGNN